jgi:hypothetical protein
VQTKVAAVEDEEEALLTKDVVVVEALVVHRCVVAIEMTSKGVQYRTKMITTQNRSQILRKLAKITRMMKTRKEMAGRIAEVED